MDRQILYTCTNENLDAIVLGLDVSSYDSVLAVGGAGDQAFALLEYAKEVTVVDCNPLQVSYIAKRAEMLEGMRYEDFLNSGTLRALLRDTLRYAYNEARLKERERYFRKRNRLDNIRSKLSGLRISEPGDVISLAGRMSALGKIYLSNAIGFNESYNDMSTQRIRGLLSAVSANLSDGGLVYVSNHDELCNGIQFNARQSAEKTAVTGFLPDGMMLDKEMTMNARRCEIVWSPAVYRKISAVKSQHV